MDHLPSAAAAAVGAGTADPPARDSLQMALSAEPLPAIRTRADPAPAVSTQVGSPPVAYAEPSPPRPASEGLGSIQSLPRPDALAALRRIAAGRGGAGGASQTAAAGTIPLASGKVSTRHSMPYPACLTLIPTAVCCHTHSLSDPNPNSNPNSPTPSCAQSSTASLPLTGMALRHRWSCRGGRCCLQELMTWCWPSTTMSRRPSSPTSLPPGDDSLCYRIMRAHFTADSQGLRGRAAEVTRDRSTV